MSRQFFTSDLHLFHQFVQYLRGFDDDQAQLESVREAFDGVRKNDVVYILGDLCLGAGRLKTACAFMDSLPGRKRLIFGNHDVGHPAYRDASAMMRRYAPSFESVSVLGQVSIQGTPFLLNHMPYDGEGENRPDMPERFSQWRFKDMGVPLIHGHTHSATKVSRSARGTIQVHVGLDAHPALVSADDVLELVAP